MSLQTVSSLVKQIKTDLEQAADLCKEIKKTRHVGHEHHALDALEASLLDSPSFVQNEYDNAKDIGGDGMSQSPSNTLQCQLTLLSSSAASP